MSIEEKIKNAKEDSWLKDSVSEEEFKQIKESVKKGDFISKATLLKAITDIDNGLNMDIYTNEVREIVEDLPTIPQTDLTYDMVEQYAKENGFVIWTKEQTEDTLRKLLNYMNTERQTDSVLEKIKTEIEQVTRFGNAYQPIEHGLLMSIIDKHISRKE